MTYCHIQLTCIHSYTTGQCHAQFECRPTDQSGEFWIPNIPSSYFVPQNASTFRISDTERTLDTTDRDTTYIFTIPAESAERNCSGNILAIQYCYEARTQNLGNNIQSFNILSLVRDGFDFTVDSSFPVETAPSLDICVDPDGSRGIQEVCCDTLTLNANTQLTIPSSSFTVGYTVVNKNVKPLQFEDTVDEYQVNRFEIDETPSAGETFMLSGANLELGPILLLRFLIGMTISSPFTQVIHNYF